MTVLSREPRHESASSSCRMRAKCARRTRTEAVRTPSPGDRRDAVGCAVMSSAEWLALAACVVAAAAIGVAGSAWILLRRVRAAQLVLLGGGKQDLVDFAVSLQARIDDLHRAIAEVAAGLSRVDRRVDSSVAKSSIVRYDAYKDTR